MELVIDTETTGLTSLSFANERNYKQWPRLVQIAWCIVNEDRIEEKEHAVIKPEGFSIPSAAVKIHGITQHRAEIKGEDLKYQLKLMSNAMQAADTLVAHNLNFDLGVIQSESMRLNYPIEFPEKRQCTAYMGQAYLRKQKGQRLSDFPRLADLHRMLLGFDYSPQHHAQTDVIACANVYIQLKQHGYTE